MKKFCKNLRLRTFLLIFFFIFFNQSVECIFAGNNYLTTTYIKKKVAFKKYLSQQRSVDDHSNTTGCDKRKNGDANCDGKIDDKDFDIWKCEFLGKESNESCNNLSPNLTADFNNDEKVDLIDFEVWRRSKFTIQVIPINQITPDSSISPQCGWCGENCRRIDIQPTCYSAVEPPENKKCIYDQNSGQCKIVTSGVIE